jgi:hypothetical protein
MLVEERAANSQLLHEQVERILRSEEFRNSEVLRRLLMYLCEKAALGESDHLKEYTVAIEGLAKPATYDPQHNSAVRIQVGRLRQKLADYYRAEGKEDPVIVVLPKGRFRLLWEQRDSGVSFAPIATPIAVPYSREAKSWAGSNRRFSPFAIVLIICGSVVALCGYLLTRSLRAHSSEVASAPGWTPDLESLWAPFIDSKRPLIVSIEDPLFVELRSNPGAYFRDRSLNEWKDVLKSPTVHKLTNSLQNADLQPSRYYTAFGEVEASFLLGKLLGPRHPVFSLVKASQLTWQQLADNNVVFIGVENLFFDQTKGLPIEPQLIPVLEGIRNPRSAPGEPRLFTDQYSTAPTEQGVTYALVTHLPGPLGSNDVESFTSNRSAGYVGAVQWFTDPKFAKVLQDKLKASAGGHMPRYYQVVLRVRFKDDVPTETTYVLSRELRSTP